MPTPNANCRADGCSRPADGGKRYCARHYAAWKRGKLPKARYATCAAEGCHKAVVDRGRCAEHLARDYPGKRAAEAAPAAAPEAPQS